VIENLKLGLMSIALQVAMGKDRRRVPRKAPSSSANFPHKNIGRFYLMAEKTGWNRLYLTPNVCVLGRSKECDVIINHRDISRRHCLFDHLRQGLLVRDLHSTNGTWINGLPAGTNTYLKPGDTICFGNGEARLYRET
jgi:hypothetical protein